LDAKRYGADASTRSPLRLANGKVLIPKFYLI